LGSILAMCGLLCSVTLADSFTPLGDLPGSFISSRAEGVSGDGSVVVGYSDGVNGTEAFRWDSVGGMVGLGDLPGGITNS